MPGADAVDVAVIGAGIVGLATARALLDRHSLDLVVLEAEDRPAAHQTGHNSGVIHSGLYYKPGSLKARLCTEGRTALEEYCRERSIPFERCGKIVVATSQNELPALEELERRGRANGLAELERLGPDGLRAHEPHVAGIAGLFVPHTGIVDYKAVARSYAGDIESRGGRVRLRCAAGAIRRDGDAFVIETPEGDVRCRSLINCGGAQADRIAVRAGHPPSARIVPFRGEYKVLAPERTSLVRNLIYPVPDPRFPFLGVHFTRMIGGGIEAGPNAVLALHRNGYRWANVSPRDLLDMARFPGFWRLIGRHWRMGMGEMHRSLSHAAFTRALQVLLPDLRAEDLRPGGAGVRAQALDSRGALLDDFHFAEAPGALHVLCAPSPAATASLAIGRHIAEHAARTFALAS